MIFSSHFHGPLSVDGNGKRTNSHAKLDVRVASTKLAQRVEA